MHDTNTIINMEQFKGSWAAALATAKNDSTGQLMARLSKLARRRGQVFRFRTFEDADAHTELAQQSMSQ